MVFRKQIWFLMTELSNWYCRWNQAVEAGDLAVVIGWISQSRQVAHMFACDFGSMGIRQRKNGELKTPRLEVLSCCCCFPKEWTNTDLWIAFKNSAQSTLPFRLVGSPVNIHLGFKVIFTWKALNDEQLTWLDAYRLAFAEGAAKGLEVLFRASWKGAPFLLLPKASPWGQWDL